MCKWILRKNVDTSIIKNKNEINFIVKEIKAIFDKESNS